MLAMGGPCVEGGATTDLMKDAAAVSIDRQGNKDSGPMIDWRLLTEDKETGYCGDLTSAPCSPAANMPSIVPAVAARASLSEIILSLLEEWSELNNLSGSSSNACSAPWLVMVSVMMEMMAPSLDRGIAVGFVMASMKFIYC